MPALILLMRGIEINEFTIKVPVSAVPALHLLLSVGVRTASCSPPSLHSFVSRDVLPSYASPLLVPGNNEGKYGGDEVRVNTRHTNRGSLKLK